MAVEPMGIPVLILKEGTQRTAGRDALRANIMAARAVAEMIKTTYGPKGMDKMLVDALGDVTITNDGATILDKAEIQHSAAKMLVQIAKSQDYEVGDGTKTAVIFAGELLRHAEELLDKNIHPTIIVSGYRKALEEALSFLYQIAEPIDINDDETLKKVARTALTSKAVHEAREHFAEISVKAVKLIAEKRGDKYYIDLDNVQIIKKYGGSLLDSLLVYGIVLDKEVVHPGMPRRVENAKIALIDAPLEIEKPEIDAEIRITDPSQLRAFLNQEEEILKKMVDKIAGTGANVVICQKGIDEVAQHFLAKKGILAVRRVKRSDMEKLEKATGGRIISNIDDLKPEDLGEAERVEERKVGEDKMVFVEGCKNPKAVSIVIRGGLERLVDEAERSLRDALAATADAVKDGKIVAGGGAVEVELAKHLRKYAKTVGGKEQLAIEAFAKSLEGLAMALAENAGLDPIEIIMKLRAEHEKEEGKWIGVNVFTGDLANMMELGVIEPVSIKANAIKSGVEAATMILRIDDVISASKIEKPEETGKRGGEEE
ncbi:thermosome subunit beta [Staphylothermus hellenicus]|uniref:Thermosome subunit beta n=1 Tax=Staphylothermus hellenicus (strain DSM 12710 / JCM 10830 / BK20S6-10-b1 / P8) TaxID=591019 RepID=D7DA51_STAHD|nr:thermosome subunit beta [Staphylothermus hellenicus]ADI32647.1 thermosome [Staphylothermus hellenicus DSM 12710]